MHMQPNAHMHMHIQLRACIYTFAYAYKYARARPHALLFIATYACPPVYVRRAGTCMHMRMRVYVKVRRERYAHVWVSLRCSCGVRTWSALVDCAFAFIGVRACANVNVRRACIHVPAQCTCACTHIRTSQTHANAHVHQTLIFANTQTRI
jgi:hypothetical protein